MIPSIVAPSDALGLDPSKPGLGPPIGGSRPSFATEFSAAVARVEFSARKSADLTGQLLRGENVELHQVAIQAQDAQTSFELLLQVRNKLVQGYQEIMRMQI